MLLVTFAPLQWYGPATAALVVSDALGELGGATPHQSIRGGLNALGTGDAPLLRPYRGRNAALDVGGEGLLHLAGARKSIRTGMEVFVSELSQDDVTGAVLEAPIEGGLTLKQALRILLAHAAGDATGLDGNPAFKSIDGSKTRVGGTISGGTRTVTIRDGD